MTDDDDKIAPPPPEHPGRPSHPDMEASAADLGLPVAYRDAPGRPDWWFERDLDRATETGLRVIVNACRSPLRQRFSIANAMSEFLMGRAAQ